jgi:hypothetical protein
MTRLLPTRQIFPLRSITMNLLHEELARAQCRLDREAADHARLAKALRHHRRAERLQRKARNAIQRASARVAVLSA